MVTATNTLLTPPRLSGEPGRDNIELQKWLQSLYDEFIDRTTRIEALEAENTSLAARITALGG